jgi:hypothetical protein
MLRQYLVAVLIYLNRGYYLHTLSLHSKVKASYACEQTNTGQH